MLLKLYYDLISQPSRAVYIFLRVNNISFEPKIIALTKGAQLTYDFKQINIFQSIPVIDDNGFNIMESNAILRYLAREKSVADHWFPKDSYKQARVDEYLEWHHHNTRFLCNFYIQRQYLMPLKTGKPTNVELVEESKDRLITCLEKIEEIWLENKKFLAGDDISIADILAACELEQTKLTDLNLKKDFPKVSNWMDRVRGTLNPHYDEAHSVINKIIQLNQK